MIIYLSLLVSLVGLIMYALSANPKVNAIGFAMFQCGLLAFLLIIPGHLVALPH
jgi:hypothetical protein